MCVCAVRACVPRACVCVFEHAVCMCVCVCVCVCVQCMQCVCAECVCVSERAHARVCLQTNVMKLFPHTSLSLSPAKPAPKHVHLVIALCVPAEPPVCSPCQSKHSHHGISVTNGPNATGKYCVWVRRYDVVFLNMYFSVEFVLRFGLRNGAVRKTVCFPVARP